MWELRDRWWREMGGGMGELSTGVQVPPCCWGQRRGTGRGGHSRAWLQAFYPLNTPHPPSNRNTYTQCVLMWGCSDVVPKYTMSVRAVTHSLSCTFFTEREEKCRSYLVLLEVQLQISFCAGMCVSVCGGIPVWTDVHFKNKRKIHIKEGEKKTSFTERRGSIKTLEVFRSFT